MRQDWSIRARGRRVASALLLCLAISGLLGGRPLAAQTQQAFLFATTQVNSNSAVATFTRNDATGALSEVPGSPFVLLTPNCYPATMEPKGRYLLGACGDGLSLYQFNSTSGVVSEVPNSPFAASTGGPPDAVIAESTGQFAYALRITRTTYPANGTATLDSFTIDAAHNLLAQPATQSFGLAGSFVGLVVDPNGHFVQILLDEAGGSSGEPNGQGCVIFFDPQSGLPVNTSSGLCQSGVVAGTNPVGISVDARGTFLGTSAKGQNLPSFSVFAISPSDGAMQASGSFEYSQTDDHPTAPFFDPTGQLVYVNSQLSGLRVFSMSVASGTVTLTELPSSPVPPDLDSTPLRALADPAADFTYLGGSNVITSYATDTTTGYPGTPVTNTFQHTPPLNFQPAFATMPPPGQAVSAPAVSLSASSLTFGPINPGQSSGPQTVTVSSTGNEALTISSVSISPAGGPFSETDSCLANPVLAPGTSCQILVSYSPGSAGVTQATLAIADNAAGSPQSVSLAGTAVAPPPPAPALTLMPGTLNFPGATTQGTSTAPQPITITNSGNASLNFSAAPALNGVNTGDFSIVSTTCGNTLVAGVSCAVSVVFSPQAAGVRTASLVLADNAANSPQSVTINGNGAAAATFTMQSGGATSVSAGQAATFNLQANPGSGFSGALSFMCSGAPTGASCGAPGVTVASGAATNFSVIVTTSGSAFLFPRGTPQFRLPGLDMRLLPVSLLALLALVWFASARRLLARRTMWRWSASLALLGLALAGCGGGSYSSSPQPTITPSGTYTLTVTPTATPSGSSKSFTLNPVTLTLSVK